MPILLVVLFFQIMVLDLPLNKLSDLFQGIMLAILGLVLFVFGLNLGLFPIGENMATSLVSKGNLFWLLGCLGLWVILLFQLLRVC